METKSVVKRSMLAALIALSVAAHGFSQDKNVKIAYVDSAYALNAPSPVIPVKGGLIVFANAFRWNGSGPTGGYWNENDVSDNVFRPVFSNVSKYRLQVYNRSGFKVFESTELYRGWDGYLSTGQRAMQGVYVWKATGTFTDGTQFSKTGDVTYLY